MNARAEFPFDACLKEALALSVEWVPRWLAALHAALQQREAAASRLHDKQAFARARSVLESHRALLGERFLSFLADALHGTETHEHRPATARPTGGRSLDSLSFDDLELMDDQQVQATVELARVQQVVKMASEEELVAFCARLSRAQGHEVVRHQANPLRPEAVVGALMRALGSLHLDDTVRARWLHVGAVSLGTELQKLYRRLTDQLDRWGVQPAGYVVVQNVPGRPAAPGHPNAATACPRQR